MLKVACNETRAEVKLPNKKHLKKIRPFLEVQIRITIGMALNFLRRMASHLSNIDSVAISISALDPQA